MNKGLKKGLKITGVTVAVILVFMLVLPFMFKDKVITIVKKEANEMLNAKLDFESLDISLFSHFPSASIELNGLTLSGIDDFENDTLVSAESIDVAVNVMSLFSDKGFDVNYVVLDKPSIKAVKLADGRVNWDIMKPDTVDVEEEKTKVQENIKEEDKPIILLVDDNEELLSMLEDLFLPIYKVYIAHDGREGLEMARQIQPDLIISDVMMPEMSGKELCYKIKTNVELSHISVVLLTAQTSVEYVVEGLMFGADDYVTKPFNVKVLIARCNNLIKNKKRLIAHYAGKTITESPVTEAINERDKELLAKCVNIIKENFENPAFDVTALASELCVGRSKLYMQFKQMTGLTPNEFILKIKLDEAMSLLKNHPELNISEISIRLGFSSPRYFSKSFKAFFGVAPQTVRSRKKE